MGTKAVLPEVRIEISINVVPELRISFFKYILFVFSIPTQKLWRKNRAFNVFWSDIDPFNFVCFAD
jgi:hypothetical protein